MGFAFEFDDDIFDVTSKAHLGLPNDGMCALHSLALIQHGLGSLLAFLAHVTADMTGDPPEAVAKALLRGLTLPVDQPGNSQVLQVLVGEVRD